MTSQYSPYQQYSGQPAHYQTTVPGTAASGAQMGYTHSQQLPPTAAVQSEPTTAPQTYIPLVDIINTGNELKIIVDTPGFDQDSISVEIEKNMLVITGSRDPDYDSDRLAGSRIERPLHLERMVQLPADCDPEKASASCENGKCIITFTDPDLGDRKLIGFQ